MVLRFRPAAVTVLAATIAALPIVPPEHVHERQDEAGHHRLAAHRHLQRHELTHRGGPDATFDDVDPVLTLEPMFVVPAPAPLPTLVLTDVEVMEPAATRLRTSLVAIVQHPIHGPPRAPSPVRAPPPSLSL